MNDTQIESHGYTIGKLAMATGVGVETIRYYEGLGLLQQPVKPLHGYRRYSNESIARLHFIRRAKRLGFSLQEIKELLQLGDGHCDDVRSLAESKLATVEEQITDLAAIKAVLDELIAACRENRDTEHCSLIDALFKKQA